jgi:phospholipase C
MLIAADSPIIDNASPHRTYQPQAPFDLQSLPAALTAAQPKLDWRNYADEHESYFKDITNLAADGSNVPSAQFDADVAQNYLPAVAWLYAPGGFSEHPPDPRKGEVPNTVIRPGMEWTVERVNKVAKSKLWASTVIFITWDDWGGWYDHVDPPNVQSWDGTGPAGYAHSQFRYGPRVPCLVISPYAKKGINSTFHSHVSLVKFCLRVFGLQPFSNAPAFAPGDQSDDMWDCFDFAQPALPPPS